MFVCIYVHLYYFIFTDNGDRRIIMHSSSNEGSQQHNKFTNKVGSEHLRTYSKKAPSRNNSKDKLFHQGNQVLLKNPAAGHLFSGQLFY